MTKYCFGLLLLIAYSGAAQTPTLPITPRPPYTPLAPLAPLAPAVPEASNALDAAMEDPGTPPRFVELPMLDCEGLPCIDVTTESGKTLRLLIDLGESNSYLDSKVAQSLGVELHRLTGGGDDSTASEVQETVVPGARFGDLAMGDFPFLVLDTTPQPDKPGHKAQQLPGDGALAFSAFRNRLLQLDYAWRVVRISEPLDSAQPCPYDCNDLVIKRFGQFGPATLTARGFAVNGQPVDVQIDNLFTGTMLVYPASVEKLGLKKEAKAKHKESFPFTQDGLKLARAEAATESYGSIQLLENAPIYFLTPDEPAPPVPFDAKVGSRLLSQGIVTFDFKGMRMWMEPARMNAAGAPAPPSR